jgi:hypothetical protein
MDDFASARGEVKDEVVIEAEDLAEAEEGNGVQRMSLEKA